MAGTRSSLATQLMRIVLKSEGVPWRLRRKKLANYRFSAVDWLRSNDYYGFRRSDLDQGSAADAQEIEFAGGDESVHGFLDPRAGDKISEEGLEFLHVGGDDAFEILGDSAESASATERLTPSRTASGAQRYRTSQDEPSLSL